MKYNDRAKWVGIVALIFIFLVSMWSLDMSVAALTQGLVLTTGFYTIDPMRTYHVSLWVAIIAVLLLVPIPGRK